MPGIGATINNQPTSSTPYTGYYNLTLGPGGGPETTAGPTTNHVGIWPIQLYYSQVITNISVNVSTGGGGANHYDAGVYSISGTTATLLGHLGATIMNTTGVQTFAFTTQLTVGPGTFLLAFTGSATTLRLICNYIGGANGGSGIYLFDTSTASTGGALPTSLTLTSTTPTATVLPAAAQWSTTGAMPLFVFT